MEIVVTARHTEVPDRYRRHLEEKLAKIGQLAPKVQRVDVVLSHEPNRRQSKACDKVEITCVDRGPVVRAEAYADDPYAALDLAMGKLAERLRRMRDRKRVHRGRRGPEGLSEASARGGPTDVAAPGQAAMNGAAPGAVADDAAAGEGGAAEGIEDFEDFEDFEGESPVVIREKVHAAVPMSLDQALYEMELVGHDFFLFIDSATSRPSVVYRRRGWSYGVITLDRRAAASRPVDREAASGPDAVDRAATG